MSFRIIPVTCLTPIWFRRTDGTALDVTHVGGTARLHLRNRMAVDYLHGRSTLIVMAPMSVMPQLYCQCPLTNVTFIRTSEVTLREGNFGTDTRTLLVDALPTNVSGVICTDMGLLYADGDPHLDGDIALNLLRG